MTFGLALPDYPWELVRPYRERAAARGVLDLSIGTPVDPTPEVVQRALRAASDAPGYPTTIGTAELRGAIADWFDRRRGVPGLDPERQILPTVGSKEMVAWLPLLLGLGPGDTVAYPSIAYPTYALGATLARAESATYRGVDELDALPASTRLLWLNTPGNPTGAVLGEDELRAAVAWGRERGAMVVADECYAQLVYPEEGRAAESVSLLDERVAGGSHAGLLAVYSLSKQSNLAGYRSSFIAGDPDVVPLLTNARKHAGMIVPAPIQAATAAALRDDEHVEAQRGRYLARRAVLRPALEAFGLTISDSVAGLYFWATEGRDAWETMGRLADLGIVAGPGVFYGDEGARHVRLAVTATDAAIEEAAARLTA